MSSKYYKFSVLLPTFNGAKYLRSTLDSLLAQNYPNLEIIVSDDCSTDTTVSLIKSLSHSLKIKKCKFKIIQNSTNIGYPGNLNRCLSHATGDIIFLMGQDDILAANTFCHYNHLFRQHPQVGAITRPYYWFNDNPAKPVRAKKQPPSTTDEIISISASPQKVISVFETLDQLSGLALRRSFIDQPFHPDIFPCHVYPFASIFKKHPVILVPNYNIAVRISSSQTRHLSSIYNKSPILSWKQFADTIFIDQPQINKYLINDFIAINYVGLVQIRNYSTYRHLIREISYLVIFRPQNLFSPLFWFFSLTCLLIPPSILISLTDWYKNHIYSKTLSHVQLQPSG